MDHNQRPQVLQRTKGPVLQKQEAGTAPPATKDWGSDLSKLIPGLAAEKELAPPVRLPVIDMGGFIAKPTISLVGSLTYGPENSVVTVSEGDFSAAMGGLANSFSVSFMKEGGGNKMPRVAFTSTIPGIGKHMSTTYTYKPPLSSTWASVFTPPPLAFKPMKLEGTARIQLEIVFEPKLPQYSPVKSPKPVINLGPAALALAFVTLMARIGLGLGRAIASPFIIILDPSLTEPNYRRREML